MPMSSQTSFPVWPCMLSHLEDLYPKLTSSGFIEVVIGSRTMSCRLEGWEQRTDGRSNQQGNAGMLIEWALDNIRGWIEDCRCNYLAAAAFALRSSAEFRKNRMLVKRRWKILGNIDDWVNEPFLCFSRIIEAMSSRARWYSFPPIVFFVFYWNKVIVSDNYRQGLAEIFSQRTLGTMELYYIPPGSFSLPSCEHSLAGFLEPS